MKTIKKNIEKDKRKKIRGTFLKPVEGSMNWCRTFLKPLVYVLIWPAHPTAHLLRDETLARMPAFLCIFLRCFELSHLLFLLI